MCVLLRIFIIINYAKVFSSNTVGLCVLCDGDSSALCIREKVAISNKSTSQWRHWSTSWPK